MLRVWDTFLLGGGPQELDMLECRLYELGDCPAIYRHVVVEGTKTFQGRDKPLYFADSESRFSAWKDKIIYVPIEPTDRYPGKQPGASWAREHFSRQATYAALDAHRATRSDLVIHGDVDEILRPSTVMHLAENGIYGPPHKFNLSYAAFAVDWLVEAPWHAPSVAYYQGFYDFTTLRESGWPVMVVPEQPAGWHLTWIGGPDAMRSKVHSFSHTERVDEIAAGIDAGKYYERGEMWGDWDPGGRPYMTLTPVDVDETWPRWVYERKCPDIWFRPREGSA